MSANSAGGEILSGDQTQAARMMWRMVPPSDPRRNRQADGEHEATRKLDQARREAYAEGYAAAVQDLTDITSGKSSKTVVPALRAAPSPSDNGKAKSGSSARLRDDFVPRMPSAVADNIVEDALRSVAPRAVGPTELLHILKKSGGSILPFTTLRRSLDRLTKQGLVEEVAGTKTWRHVRSRGNLSGNTVTLRPVG